MALETWLAFLAASAAIVLIPGPTVLLVLSYALSQGRRVAVSTALGVALGAACATTASVAGLGALVLASASLFTVLKWVGAAYLVYLGLRMIVSARTATVALPTAAGARDVADVTARTTFRHAATVTALNPKGITFFIAFVPQFVEPEAALLPQFAILIASFVTLAALNALAYALLADQLRARLTRPGVLAWLTRAGGATLIGMGILTATLRRGTA